MSDGSQQGIKADRAIETILGGKRRPSKGKQRSPEWWLSYLKEKNDDIDGYSDHAEVMAKYILEAYKKDSSLTQYPISRIYQEPINWDNPVILSPDLSDKLKSFYPRKSHPFRKALSEATGFTWGWAFNIARYALKLPPQPNPAIVVLK